MIGSAMCSEDVDAHHHPDEQEGNGCDDDIANPLGDGSGLGAVFHGLMVATSATVLIEAEEGGLSQAMN